MKNALLNTEIKSYPLCKKGKVRDIYEVEDQLLIVATDRISAFDSVMPNPSPDKGALLTGITSFWFSFFENTLENHLVTCSVDNLDLTEDEREQLTGRSMIVKKSEVIPVECVVRGYLAGSGWREYSRQGTVCGIRLPENLQQCSQLETPLFTPSTKAETGHDENISFEQMKEITGTKTAEYLRKVSIDIYNKAAAYAREKQIIIADTKFEFGVFDGRIVLIDEILTPDSSRFWPAEQYEPGKDQESFDKQFLRNYLEEIKWDKEPPAPELPEEIITKTRNKYLKAYQLLTEKSFESGGNN